MELAEDIIIIPAETAAHMWMDRFIKTYEYGTDKSVKVKGNKIIWNDIFDTHSICVVSDRFIIDGNEIFINPELWHKYLRMRELAGAIYVRAPKKIAFPDDWTELSDERVLENIQYLQKNYKKYQISQPDDKHIKIDNVIICRDNENEISNSRICFTINNKKYYRNENNGKELIDLIHLCKMQMRPLKEKILDCWKKDKSTVCEGSFMAALFIGACILANYAGKHRQDFDKDNKQEENIKKSQDDLQKKQAKVIKFTDLIKQNIR